MSGTTTDAVRASESQRASAGTRPAPGAGITAHRAADFLNSLGVNSSICTRDEIREKTVETINYLGMRWVRTHPRLPLEDLLEVHRQTGVRYALIMLQDGDIAFVLDVARKLAAAGALLAIEGPNEPMTWPVAYPAVPGGPKNPAARVGGRRGSWLPVAELQRDLYKAVKADPVLKDYPVWHTTQNGNQPENVGLQFLTIPPGAGTLMPEGTTYADYANCHNYVVHPGWPGVHDNQTWIAASPGDDFVGDGLYNHYGVTWMKGFQGYSVQELERLPKVSTETGCGLFEANPWNITEEIQGLLLLNLYLSFYKRGWSHTCVYLLRDRTDETGDQRYGFYRPDYTPRKAAEYLHNLTTILRDDDKPAEAPAIQHPGNMFLGPGAWLKGKLSYTIADQPDTVHDLLLQKSDGRFVLVVWNERFGSGGVDEVTVDLGARFDTVKVYDPTVGTAPVRVLANERAVKLTLENHPVVIELQ